MPHTHTYTHAWTTTKIINLCLNNDLTRQALVKNELVRTDLGLVQQQEQPQAPDAEESPTPAAEDPTAEADTAFALAAAIAGVKGGDPSYIPLEHDILDSAVDALCLLLTPSVALPGSSGSSSPLSSVQGTAAAHVRQGLTTRPAAAGTLSAADVGDDSGGIGIGGGGVAAEAEEIQYVERHGEGGRAGEGAGAGGAGAGSARAGRSVGRVGDKESLAADAKRRRRQTPPPSPPPPPPRRHHLVLRLCGKVLASLARQANPDGSNAEPSTNIPNSEIPNPDEGRGRRKTTQELEMLEGEEFDGDEPALVLPPQLVAAEASVAAAGAEYSSLLRSPSREQSERLPQNGRGSLEGGRMSRAGQQGLTGGVDSLARNRHDTVLRRVGEALAVAAEAVVNRMGSAEGPSIVAFEEEVRSRPPARRGGETHVYCRCNE